MDTIITLQGVLKILTTSPMVLWVDNHTFHPAVPVLDPMSAVNLLNLQHPWLQHLQSPYIGTKLQPSWTRHTCINSDNTKQKWVFNLSNTPSHQHKEHYWQEAQTLPKYPSTPQGILHYSGGKCLFQPPREADEFRSDISHILRNPNHNHKTNLTIQECRALTEQK